MSVVRFEEGKLWFKKEENVLTIGISPEALDELVGEVMSLALPSPEDDFTKQEYIVEVEGSEGNLRVYTPASGLITEINNQIKDNAELVNEDPEEEGWLVRIEIDDESELTEYL